MGTFSGELQLTAAIAAADKAMKRRGFLNLQKISCRIATSSQYLQLQRGSWTKMTATAVRGVI
jgi:hypothetical protein